MITAIVIDIEGTTSPTSSVREGSTTTPAAHLAHWLADNLGGAADPVIAETRELAAQPDAGPTEVAEILSDWLDSDVKAEPLKTAQGLICAEGFRSGALHGEFFHDVPAALAAWRAAGIALYIFSSGSVRNQQDWFAHARGGELASLISGWFDLANAGAKRESSSYKTIAEAIGVEPTGSSFCPTILTSSTPRPLLVGRCSGCTDPVNRIRRVRRIVGSAHSTKSTAT